MGIGEIDLCHQVHQRAGGDALDNQDLGRSQEERLGSGARRKHLLGSQGRGIEQGASFVECEGLLGRTQVRDRIPLVVPRREGTSFDWTRLAQCGSGEVDLSRNGVSCS